MRAGRIGVLGIGVIIGGYAEARIERLEPSDLVADERGVVPSRAPIDRLDVRAARHHWTTVVAEIGRSAVWTRGRPAACPVNAGHRGLGGLRLQLILPPLGIVLVSADCHLHGTDDHSHCDSDR